MPVQTRASFVVGESTRGPVDGPGDAVLPGVRALTGAQLLAALGRAETVA